MATQRQFGFTLLEMAVVLVAIGLIVGSIVVGQSMIRTAKISVVVTDIGRYTQAVTDFSDKYKALPGDLSLAETYWGSDSSCPNTPYTATPHVATCNGDGSGQIEYGTEMFRAWQQMSDAGLISGSYTGVMGPGGAGDHTLGLNAPKTSLANGGFDLFDAGDLVGDASYFDGNYQLKLGLGAPVSGSPFNGALFTPAEALAIDQKLDDGAPGTGNIMTFKSTVTPGCTTTDVASTALYKTSSSSIACSLNIIIPVTVQ